MRKALAIATFVVAGASAIGAGAALSFNGSDTLGDFTAELITNKNQAGTAVIPGTPFCHELLGSVYVNDAGVSDPFAAALNGNLVYLGGGSGTGENNMAAGKQAIAPMSKFLTKASCVASLTVENGSSTTSAATQANGLVVALDGLSILGATTTAGTTSCNGNPADVACAGEPAFGLAFNTNINYTALDGTTATYTFQVWQDVLKALYFGTLNSTAPAAVKALGCANPVRAALANNWGSIFENSSCAGSGSALGIAPCTQLQHIFRRDDASGTSDIFSSLLGASGPNTISNVVNAEVGVLTVTGGAVAQQYGMGTDSFCNDFQNQSGKFKTVWPGSNPPNLYQAPVFTTFSNGNGVIGSQAVGNAGVVPNDDQDYDAIRRPCQGNGASVGNATVPNPSEQVCNRGSLDLANTTAIALADGGTTFNCGANDGGVCPGNEICYAPANTGTQTNSQGTNPSGQCWGGVDTAASQVAVNGHATCAAGGGTGSCPFSEQCLLANGSAPAAGQAGQCWTKPAQGSLGLLLPMVDSTILATQVDPNNAGLNIQYDVTATATPQLNLCTGFTTVTPPFVYKYSNTGIPSRTRGLCPNGDLSFAAGNLCYVPADADGNPNCITLAGSQSISTVQCSVGGSNPGPNGGGQGTLDGVSCSGYGPDPGKVDPRVYNLYAYRNSGTCTGTDSATGECNAWSGQWVMAIDDSSLAPGGTTPRPVFGGAYFKIHTTQDMMIPNAASYDASALTNKNCKQGAGTATQVACPTVCTQADMTDQIGCVVQASPCSLGYAGRHAEQQAIHVGGTTGLTSGTTLATIGERVTGIPDQIQCIQNFVSAGEGVPYYPISRKLYLNSTPGFGLASTAEQALAGCESTTALINQAVDQNFFVRMPTTLADGGPTVNGGNPFCEDFNEQMLCTNYPFPGETAGTQRNACPDSFALGLGNGTQTTCGNGIVEQYEDCDFGTLGVTSTGVVIPTDGGLVNGQTTLSDGGALAPGAGCSQICRKQ